MEKVASRTLPETPLCAKNIAPAMVFTLPTGYPQVRFGLHFVFIFAPFWPPVAPQGRSRDEKEPFQKSLKKRHGKGCPKVSKMTSEMGRQFRPRAPFLSLWSHLRSRWGPDPNLVPFCIKIYNFSINLGKNVASPADFLAVFCQIVGRAAMTRRRRLQ